MQINLNQSPSIFTNISTNGSLDFYNFGIQQGTTAKTSFEFDITYNLPNYADFLSSLVPVLGESIVPFIDTFVGIANVVSVTNNVADVDTIRGINLESYGTRHMTYQEFIAKITATDYSNPNVKNVTVDLDQTNDTLSVYDGSTLIATRTDAGTQGSIIPFVYSRLSFAIIQDGILNVPFNYKISDLPVSVQDTVSQYFSNATEMITLNGSPMNLHTGFVTFDSLNGSNLPPAGGASGSGEPISSVVVNPNYTETFSASTTDVGVLHNTISQFILISNSIPGV